MEPQSDTGNLPPAGGASARAATRAIRAGWILTMVFAAMWGLFIAELVSSKGRGSAPVIHPVMQVGQKLAFVYGPAILLLSCVAFRQGAVRRGLLLLLGAPLLLYGTAFAVGLGFTERDRRQEQAAMEARSAVEALGDTRGEDSAESASAPAPPHRPQGDFLLTGTNGETVLVWLVSLKDDVLSLRYKERPFEIKMGVLTAESQARVRKRFSEK